MLFLGPRQGIEDGLECDFEIIRLWKTSDADQVLQARGAEVTYAVTHTGLREMNKALLDRLPNLKMVANVGVGFESIDVQECRRRGVQIANGAGANAVDVAEFAIGLMLDLSRHISYGDRYVRSGQWTGKSLVISRRLTGRTLGILGLGKIGVEIATRAEALGMKVVYHSRHRKNEVHHRFCETVQRLAEEADYLVIATPGGDETRHLVNESVLRALGPEGYLINIARGSVVDEAALLHALQKKWILGAALDVYENEPEIPREFFELDNLTLQPHQGGATREAIHETSRLAVANIRAHAAGQPLLTPVL